ncbi:MAG: hypothetical protein HY420_00200 [Candidatus Kerfeldbacteria bacterium]|nr:hypothetical protein [Candidatus Kerfeldbacteria bacterium]
MQSPHEIHAPTVSPIFKGSSRQDKLAMAVIFLVVFSAGGVTAWWWLKGKASPVVNAAERNAGRAQNSGSGNKLGSGDSSAPLVATNSQAANESATDSAAPFSDDDNDGVLNDVEALYGTGANKADSDGDGFSDGTELSSGYDPMSPGKGRRMVDLALVERLAKDIPNVQVLSSGISTGDKQRYYLVYDGVSTSYYEVDGTLKSQCQVEVEQTGTCATLPNELRTDFSRSFIDGTISDAYHIPF